MLRALTTCLAGLALLACRPLEPAGAPEALDAGAVEIHATCARAFDPGAAEHGRLRIEAHNATREVAALPHELWLTASAAWLKWNLAHLVDLGAHEGAALAPGATVVLLDLPLDELLLSREWDWLAHPRPPRSPVDGAVPGADGVARLRLGVSLERGRIAPVGFDPLEEVELVIEAPAAR